MNVIVPDEGQYDQVLVHLDTVVGDLSKAEPLEVDLRLPKFDIALALGLKDQLVALGMSTAFSDQADFSAMTHAERLEITNVIHQANVTVDEKGTVAAAASGVVMGVTSAPMRIEQLIVDRPFVFLIRDVPTGAILFAGQVTNPSSKT
jgi:serpin B